MTRKPALPPSVKNGVAAEWIEESPPVPLNRGLGLLGYTAGNVVVDEGLVRIGRFSRVSNRVRGYMLRGDVHGHVGERGPLCRKGSCRCSWNR